MAHIIAPGVVFNHNPKCGGEWVIQACKNAGCYVKVDGTGRLPSHSARWQDFNFTFVRNPQSWVRSWHSYKATHQRRDNNFDNLWVPDLNDTVKLLCEKQSGFLTRQYVKYASPIKGHRSYVGKQEFLEDHLVLLLKLARVDFDEVALRQTSRKNESYHEQSLYQTTMNLLRKAEAPIYKAFYFNHPFPSNSIIVFQS